MLYEMKIMGEKEDDNNKEALRSYLRGAVTYYAKLQNNCKTFWSNTSANCSRPIQMMSSILEDFVVGWEVVT